MTILGIETSCDETSAAIITGEKDSLKVLANVISSSLEMHAQTGGIIPENAAREQVKYIIPVIKDALKKANMEINDIDAFAVTYGPGLIGSLLVGVETVKTLAFTLQKPMVPINHLVGHVYANWLTQPSNEIAFPTLALVVSGGHTDLLLMKNHGDFELLGGTRDDAAGECFDKCARLLGYPYPGGPKISSLAQKGNPQKFPFPRPMLGSKDYDFSFSGLKTAFLKTTTEHFPILQTQNTQTKGVWQQVSLENQLTYDLCASLQAAIVDVLVKKTLKAAQQYNVQSILLSGGVAANQTLRDEFSVQSAKLNIKLFCPEKKYCTDNAAMIAAAAYYNLQPADWKEITADPELYFEPEKIA